MLNINLKCLVHQKVESILTLNNFVVCYSEL